MGFWIFGRAYWARRKFNKRIEQEKAMVSSLNQFFDLEVQDIEGIKQLLKKIDDSIKLEISYAGAHSFDMAETVSKERQMLFAQFAQKISELKNFENATDKLDAKFVKKFMYDDPITKFYKAINQPKK